LKPPAADPQASAARAADRAAAADLSTPLYTREFWFVFTANFALNMAGSLFVMLPAFVMHLGGGAAMIGAVIAVGGVAALAVRPLNGVAVDRWGIHRVAVRCLILDAIATALYVPLGSLRWPLFAVRIIHGAIDGTARVALFAMAYELLPQGRQGQAMATFTLCSMIPAAIGPIMGEEIIDALGFGWFFAAATAMCAAAGAITASAPARRARAPHDPHREPAATASFGQLLRSRALMPLWIVTLLWSVALASRTFVIPFAYQEGVARVGWYFMLYCGVAVVLRMFAAGLLDRVGLRRIVTPALALTALGLGLLAFTGRFGMLYLAAIAGGVGHGYFYPALCAQVIGHTRPEQMGRSSAIFTSVLDLGGMAGPYLLGLMAAGTGYPQMFLVSAAIAALSAGCYLAQVR
jgi:MFS family permease